MTQNTEDNIVNSEEVGNLAEQYAISKHSRGIYITNIEIGPRVETSSKHAATEKALGAQKGARTQWVSTEANPGGSKMIPAQLTADAQGRFRITKEALQCVIENSTSKRTCIMFKITGTFHGDFFSAPAYMRALKEGEEDKRLVTLDPSKELSGGTGMRESGEYVYSFPQHHLTKVGSKKFFYVLTFFKNSSNDTYTFAATRVEVELKEDEQGLYFQVSTRPHANLQNTSLHDLEHNHAKRDIRLKDLPIAKFVERIRNFKG